LFDDGDGNTILVAMVTVLRSINVGFNLL